MELTSKALIDRDAPDGLIEYATEMERNYDRAPTIEEVLSSDVGAECFWYLLDYWKLEEKEIERVKKHLDYNNSSQIYHCLSIINSENVSQSTDIKDSKIIRYSNDVSTSANILNSKEIRDSQLVTSGQYINNSFKIYNSSYIQNSEQIANSKNVTNSKNIFYSSFIQNCSEIHLSKQLKECHFCANSEKLDHCLFCWNLKNKSYYMFNKPIDIDDYSFIETQYRMINPLLLNNFTTNFESTGIFLNYTSTTPLKDFPKDLLDWVKDYSTYDPTIMAMISLNEKLLK